VEQNKKKSQKIPLTKIFTILPDDTIENIENIEQHLSAMTIQEYNEKYNINKIKNLLDEIFFTNDLYNLEMRFIIFIKTINKKFNSDKEIKQLVGTYLLNTKNNAIKSLQYIDILSKLKENSDSINKMLKKFGLKHLKLVINTYINHIINTYSEITNYISFAKQDYRIAELNLNVSPRIDKKNKTTN
tara:strand:+ start:308 stop:868 length:561 start_codon:yes stop_codon:yes gene_type:complete